MGHESKRSQYSQQSENLDKGDIYSFHTKVIRRLYVIGFPYNVSNNPDKTMKQSSLFQASVK